MSQNMMYRYMQYRAMSDMFKHMKGGDNKKKKKDNDKNNNNNNNIILKTITPTPTFPTLPIRTPMPIMNHGRCPLCNYSLIPYDIECIDGIVKAYFCSGFVCNYNSIPTITIWKNKTKDETLPTYVIHHKFAKITVSNEQLNQYIKEGMKQLTTVVIKEKESTTTSTSDKGTQYTLELGNIIGFEGIKETLRDIINTQGVHLLISGAPATAKTVFLKSIQKELEEQGAKCKYIDATMMTKVGLYNTLFSMQNVEFLLLDEIDKLETEHQSGILNLAETGILQQMTARNNREKYLGNMTIITSANYLHKILEPLRTRFLTVYIKAYTKEQYYNICVKMLQYKYKYIDEPLANYIATESYNKIKPPSMRTANRIGKMIRREPTTNKVDEIITNINKYEIPKDIRQELYKQI